MIFGLDGLSLLLLGLAIGGAIIVMMSKWMDRNASGAA